MDICERLRSRCHCNLDSSPCGAEDDCRIDEDAAAEIERLKAELRRAKAVNRVVWRENHRKG